MDRLLWSSSEMKGSTEQGDGLLEPPKTFMRRKAEGKGSHACHCRETVHMCKGEAKEDP